MFRTESETAAVSGGHSKDTETVRFRKLRPDEHAKTRPLYEACFSEDSKEFVDYYYSHRAVCNTIYVAEDTGTGEIVAMLHLNPVKVSCLGRIMDIPYVVAVATKETCRHRGYMRQLLTMAHQDMLSEHIPFAFLMPADEKIYEPFGYQRAWPWRWEEDVTDPASEAGIVPEAAGKDADPADRVPEAAGKDADPADRVPEAAGKVSISADRTSNAQLEALAEHVNQALSEQFDLYTVRSVSYYRDLQDQQEASEGRLVIRTCADGTPLSAVCTAKEEFPPMMTRVIDRAAFSQLCGNEEIFKRAMICEVV